jgi:hypothetical protein
MILPRGFQLERCGWRWYWWCCTDAMADDFGFSYSYVTGYCWTRRGAVNALVETFFALLSRDLAEESHTL